jgi:hypothetical protein
MGPGYGYWIKMNEPANLIYPLDTPAAPPLVFSGGPIAVPRPNNYAGSNVTPTNTSLFVYGKVTIDDKEAQVGDVVTVYTEGGTLAGEFIVAFEGMYGSIAVYGDDLFTERVEGAHEDEKLYFKVNGHPADAVTPYIPLWTEDRDVIRVDLATRTEVIPKSFHLEQNYPNPFNPETWVPFRLSETAKVTIRIYNVSGQLVRTLDLGNKEAGVYGSKELAAYWNGKNDDGESVTSGTYFYELSAGEFKAVRKMVLLK